MEELLARISSRELTEWMAFDRLEPFGEWRADVRAAMVAMVMANAWRGKDQKAYKLDDFLIKFDAEPRKAQTVEEQMKIFEMLTGVMGG